MKTMDQSNAQLSYRQRQLTPMTLRHETRSYRNRGGISAETRGLGCTPAFLDTETGAVYPSRFSDGRIAPMHLLDGLPGELVLQRRESGAVTAVKASVISGFLYHGRFLTRSQAAETLHSDTEAAEYR